MKKFQTPEDMAIEKLRTRIAELETSRDMFAKQWAVADAALVRAHCRSAELEAAIDKLAQCKGRFHTEANFKALMEVRNKSLHK